MIAHPFLFLTLKDELSLCFIHIYRLNSIFFIILKAIYDKNTIFATDNILSINYIYPDL